jgi:NADH-quinone oxidoreductase subunit M
MIFGADILTVITFLPTVGALLLFLVPGRDEASHNIVRWIALVVTTVTFALSLWLWAQFDASEPGFQFVENYPWIGQSIGYRMGVDGISILFIPLTALLMPAVVLASWGPVTTRVREYYIVFLVLETFCLGVFATLDLAMFYFFFEGSLIPMFLIIGIWGGKRRIQAAYKFFFYSFTGTVLMLLAIMFMFWQANTLDIRSLLQFRFPPEAQFWLWLAFFASFAVKLPMWPLHRWLPEAHVEAPTAGSVILAAILLKLGGYGFIRFSLSMFPEASADLSGFVFVFSIAAIIITSLVALVQTDMKKLIAYSSVAHMGFVTMGIFAANEFGLQGAIFQMLSHGLVSAALFLCVGVVYDRMHTREIEAYGGLVQRMPQYAFAFMVFTMANVGLPGTSGFVGEFLTMLAIFQVNTWVAFFAAFGVILSAAYALWLYRRVIFGPLIKDGLKSIKDLSRREQLILAPLVILVVFFGFYPMPLLDVTAASVDSLVMHTQAAIDATTQLATVEAGH